MPIFENTLVFFLKKYITAKYSHTIVLYSEVKVYFDFDRRCSYSSLQIHRPKNPYNTFWWETTQILWSKENMLKLTAVLEWLCEVAKCNSLKDQYGTAWNRSLEALTALLTFRRDCIMTTSRQRSIVYWKSEFVAFLGDANANEDYFFYC